MMDSDERLRAAFQNLSVRAAATEAPNVFSGGGRQPRRDRERSWKWVAVPAVAVAVLSVALGALTWVGDDGSGIDVATNDGSVPVTDPASGVEQPDRTLPGSASGVTAFDQRPTDDVFGVRIDGVGLSAGFVPSTEPLRLLPVGAVDAAPDGAGGLVYVTTDEVWHLAADREQPELLERPGVPVSIVGPRSVAGEPSVLIRIGGKIIQYRADSAVEESFLVTTLSVEGSIIDLALEQSTLAAVVEAPDGTRSVYWKTLGDDVAKRLTASVDADDEAAPVAVAVLSRGRVVVADSTARAAVITTEGVRAGEVVLPVSPAEVSTFALDGAGDRVLIAFGEAAVAVDVSTATRHTVDDLDLSVQSAMWAVPPVSPPAAESAPGSVGSRYRVDTEAVAADTRDPFLNVRSKAGTGGLLVAKLPPTYRGLRATGAAAEAADGGTWIEVELLDPVAVDLDPTTGRDGPTGWVNAAFVVLLPDGIAIGTDDVRPCRAAESPVAGGGGGPWHVYGLESAFVAADCLRVVITFGHGAAPLSWADVGVGAAPAATAPAVADRESGGNGAVIDLGPVADAWLGARETADGVYVVRDSDGTLDLVSPLPVRGSTIVHRPELGVVVIDLVVDGSAPPTGAGVVLTRQPFVGSGYVEVIGIATPFEATLDVSIVDSDGTAVAAVFSGHRSLGTVEGFEYGVDTNDWTDAWGTFAVRASVAAGRYTMILSADGGSDDPDRLRIPFVVTDSGEVPLADPVGTRAAQDLYGFAWGGDVNSLPLADEVILGLGVGERRVASRGELADRGAWTFDVDSYAGYAGPFNVLDVLSGGRVIVTAGTLDHCAAPPLTLPADLAQLEQVNMTPIGIDSCLSWYAVNVFLDDEGAIAAVLLDLSGP